MTYAGQNQASIRMFVWISVFFVQMCFCFSSDKIIQDWFGSRAASGIPVGSSLPSTPLCNPEDSRWSASVATVCRRSLVFSVGTSLSKFWHLGSRWKKWRYFFSKNIFPLSKKVLTPHFLLRVFVLTFGDFFSFTWGTEKREISTFEKSSDLPFLAPQKQKCFELASDERFQMMKCGRHSWYEWLPANLRLKLLKGWIHGNEVG